MGVYGKATGSCVLLYVHVHEGHDRMREQTGPLEINIRLTSVAKGKKYDEYNCLLGEMVRQLGRSWRN